jgi:hypothetical protein
MFKAMTRIKELVNRRRTVLAALVMMGGMAAGVGVAFSTSENNGGVYVPRLGMTIPADKLARHLSESPSESATQSARESGETGPPPADTTIMPGRLLGSGGDNPVPVSSSILTPVNEWIVDNGNMFIGVYAGSAGDDASVGRLVIFRDNHATTEQTEKTIDIAGGGALTITNAPLGKAAAAVAKAATLTFKTSGGNVGTLDLETDTVDIGS